MEVTTVSGRRARHHVLTHGRESSLPIVMLHGFLGDMFSWQYCIVPLARYGRIMALDLPGHGRNLASWSGHPAGWLEDALDALEVSRCHVVAHSFGAWIALQGALRAPDRFASLSLVACAGLDSRFNLLLLRQALAADDLDKALAYAQSLAGRSCDSVPRMARHHLEQMGSAERRSILTEMLEDMIVTAASGEARTVNWEALPMPLRFFWSRDDRIVPLPESSSFPPAPDLMLNEDGGHIPHILRPAWLTAGIGDFLASLQRQPA